MEKEVIYELSKNFEAHSYQEDEVEYWLARDLQFLLGYSKWNNFEKVIVKAKEACKGSNNQVIDHFLDVGKMVELGSTAGRKINDIKLTRYACYLIAQNGDPRKQEIAFAMTYFATQTRKQEVLEKKLAELERVQAREKLTSSEKELSSILFERGVDSRGFALIRSRGDTALFGGNDTKTMKTKLSVPTNRALADFLPTVTMKAKDLANEITNYNVKKNLNIKGEEKISSEHVKNNENMREMLKKSDIIPENLPAEEDVKKVERRLKSEAKKLSKGTKKLQG